MKEIKCDKCDKRFASKDALSAHNRDKHPELYTEPRISNAQKRRIRNYIIVFAVLSLFAGVVYWRVVPPKDAPIIDISPEMYNFGTVSQMNGEVSTEMTLTNKGSTDLILNGMDSSCGCTSASIVYNGTEGPRFTMAMHGTNPTDWEQVIPPGGTVQLKIYYDPNVHKNLKGEVTRSVFISSNDPRHKKKEVRISVYQTA